MKKEKRDLYDKNLKLTGKTYYKGDKVPEGYYPMVVMIAIENSKGEFLMQKRVPRKGGDYGVTGGHPKSGETPYEGIITEVKEELGIGDNETTTDGLFSLSLVSCLGCCSLAPVMMINEDTYGSLTPDKVKQILRDIREKEGM